MNCAESSSSVRTPITEKTSLFIWSLTFSSLLPYASLYASSIVQAMKLKANSLIEGFLEIFKMMLFSLSKFFKTTDIYTEFLYP